MSYKDELEAAAARATEASNRAEAASQIIHDVANGLDNQTVVTANGEVVTVANALKQLKEADFGKYDPAEPLTGAELLWLKQGDKNVHLAVQDLPMSVNGQVGEVVLDTDDVAEGVTNKYYPSEDATKLAGIQSGAEVNDVDSVNGQTGIVVLDTDDLEEGVNNKYYPSVDADKLAGIEENAQVNTVTSVNAKTGDVSLNAADVGAIPSAEKGVANGVASLDSTGKVPEAHLPDIGSGDVEEAPIDGNQYGRQDGEWTMITGGGGTGAVDSVNGQTGVVELTTDDVPEGSTNSYYPSADASKLAGIEALAEKNKVNSVNGQQGTVLITANNVGAIPTTEKGQPEGVATLGADGLVPSSQLPDLGTARKVTVADETARLALSPYTDLIIAYQSDDGSAWALNANEDPSVSANWSPLGSNIVSGVGSFNGRTGYVTPQTGDYTASQVGAVSIDSAGQANGVATLDETGIVPVNQLPPYFGGGGGGGGGYSVATRVSSANQVHVFPFTNIQYSFGFDAFALKQDAPLTGQTFEVESFDSSSSGGYQQTSDLVWDGELHPYAGEVYETVADGDFFSTAVKGDGASLRITSISGRPGPISFIGGDPAAGFYGEVPVSELIDGEALAQKIGLDSGDAINSDSPWLKFSLDGVTLYVAKKHYRGRLTWGAIDSVDAVYGNRTVEINGLTYKIRLLKGAEADPTGLSTGFDPAGSEVSEWNKLMYRVHSSVPGTQIGMNWAEYTDEDIEVGVPGISASWTQESKGGDRILRGRDGISFFYVGTNSAGSSTGWRPVLELVDSSLPAFVLSDNSNQFYSSSAGTLTPIAEPLSVEDIARDGVIDTGVILSSELSGKLPMSVVSGVPALVHTRFTLHSNQIAVQNSTVSTISWQKINSATVSATEVGAGKVRLAVSRDGLDWKVWDGLTWTSIGALAADTTGADSLILNGMSPTEVESIGEASWASLFSDTVDGSPDSLAFAYAFEIPEASVDNASIDSITMNTDFKGAWKKQSPSEVEIRWYNDQVTFKTINAGDYKLAYQDAV